MPARALVSVVCALLEDEHGRLLLAQRPPGKHLAGYWEFPGGKVEPGETPAAALARELAEELGCTAVLGDALRPVRHAYPTLTVELLPFLARLAPGSPPPVAREHTALRWADAAEIASLPLPAADAPILAEWRERRAARPGAAPAS